MYVLDNPSGGALPSPPSSPLGGTGKPVEVRRGPATVAGVKAPAVVAASAHVAEGKVAGAKGGCIALPREPGDLPPSRAPAAVIAAGGVLASEGDAEN